MITAMLVIALVAPVSVLAGATVLCVLSYGWAGLHDLLVSRREMHGRHRATDPLDELEDAYRDARREMNSAAGKDWLNTLE